MAIDINIETQVSQTITDGVTDKAPSENAVFDALANKVDKETGKGLSEEDFTMAEKNKLAGIEAGAEVNVNADWNATSGDAEILNKPTIPDVALLVPYTGAVADVNLGTHKLTAKDLVVNHPSGSGDAATITKGGSGEALKVVKSSGSGNAASITGGVTLLEELKLNTKLADAEIASAATWNAKIGGAVSIGQVAFGTAAGVIGGDNGLFWDNVNKRLGVGGAHGALIVVGDSGVNNSTLAKILISTTVPSASPYAEHAFSDSSQLENGLSYNSFDARINIKENIIGAGGHYAAFQSVPMIAAAKTLSTYYGHYDGAIINGAITNYYANISQINGGNITNYYGLAVTKSGTPTISNVQGVHIGAFNSVNFTGISIAGANGSTQARGISIVGLNGGNVRPIYTEISTAVFAPNEFKYTGSGNKDLLMLSRSAINNNEETGIVWEAGSGATKYYSSRISSSYSDGLKGSIIFYNNKTSGAGINSLVESARINSNGLGIGVTPTARLEIKGEGTTTGFTIKTQNAIGVATFTVLDSGNVGVGTASPNSSALVDITSTTKGFLPPRMTNAQRLAIASPAIGLMVYCTDAVEGLYVNKSTGWTFII